jgi:hypothetical protein
MAIPASSIAVVAILPAARCPGRMAGRGRREAQWHAKRLQSGRLDAYLLYMLIALIAVVAVVTALA